MTRLTNQELVFITPHLPGSGLPSRPAALLAGLSESGRFGRVRVVNRVRPTRFVRTALAARSIPGRWLTVDQSLPGGPELVSHPWPFGPFEDGALVSIVQDAAANGGGAVVWVCDPKSAGILRRLRTLTRAGARRDRGSGPLATVFDAYDAWDLSPLVRGKRRRDAVRRGYAIAAGSADVVFANTGAMAERLLGLGAANVHLLPNGCPPVDPMLPAAEPYLAYVGRVHERFDCSLVTAAAAANPATSFRIAGPVERVPDGWRELLALPNIAHLGALDANAARSLIGRSRGLLVPHLADAYTRSQDAMKAWEALSTGTPVVSTSVPPADEWSPPVALVADEPGPFAEACRRLLAGELDAGRSDRLALAAQNGWDRRVRVALDAIAEVTGA